MRKVLFTESQMKKILQNEGFDYIDKTSTGTESPDNVDGYEVTMNGDKVTDKIGKSVKGRVGFAFGAGNRYHSGIYEDIEQQRTTATNAPTVQKVAAEIASTDKNSKLAKNILDDAKNKKSVSNGTNRVRKFREEQKIKNTTDPNEKMKHMKIKNALDTSATQMSTLNNIQNNEESSASKMAKNSVKSTNVSKGHHDNEELNNGVLHYFS